LPLPSQIGSTRVGGVDLNQPRIRAALQAVLALAPAPGGFTVAQLAAKVQQQTGQTDADYTIRQAAYDLRKLRGKHLVVKPGRSHRYQVPTPAACTIAGLLALRDQVIGPILAGSAAPTGPQARPLDGHRPRLRDPTHRHADPLRRLGHRRIAARHNDNILSIRVPQAARRGADQGEHGFVGTRPDSYAQASVQFRANQARSYAYS
jgi:hypothetical protein